MSDYRLKPAFTQLNLETLTLALVVSQFNAQITTALKEGAIHAFIGEGASKEQISIFEVPGAFEIPLVAKKLALTGKYNAVICLGAVIKGETAHFDFVASSSISGISQVALETGIPILCGILTTENLRQAQERSGSELNIGRECLYSALNLIQTLQNID